MFYLPRMHYATHEKLTGDLPKALVLGVYL